MYFYELDLVVRVAYGLVENNWWASTYFNSRFIEKKDHATTEYKILMH